MITEVKGLLQSKTIWGVIITAAGALLGWGAETQAVMTDQAMQAVSAGVQAVGAVMTIYGRIRAEKKVTVTGS